MKICWIVPGFQSDATDRCIPALTDLAHKVARHHDLTVYALQYPGREDRYRIGAVTVRSFRPSPPMGLPKVGRLGSLGRAVWEIGHAPGDLVHAFWAAQPALVGGLATRLRKRPLIVACMGGETARLPQIGYGAALKPLDRAYLRLAVEAAQVITVGSDFQGDLLKAHFGSKVRPVWLPLGVDLTRFGPPPPRAFPARPIALAVGSLLPVKGHARLIEALSDLPDVELRIVGEGPERPRLETLIRELGLTNRVKLVGAVDPARMPAEYAAADFLVLPSYYESQCVALLEALAGGLPVVAAPVGIAPQVLTDRRAGELAAANTPSALVTAIRRLLNRPAEWSYLQQAARRIAEDFSLEACTDRLLRLYQQVNDVYK